MITDIQTNKLFLADCLPKKQPKFFQRFEKVLNDCNINFQFLPNTNDIWAVDFMPVQVSKDKFVQFNYSPDYLQPKKYQKTISDVDSICKAIKVKPLKSNLIIDAGNIVRVKDKVIMCDKVFNENKNVREKVLISLIKETLQIDQLFFVPWDKSDFIGHADGMVRFIDSNTVLINDYSLEKPEYQCAFRMALHNAGLDWIELPYNPYDNKPKTSAEGIYVNYLQMNNIIFVPTYKRAEDEIAVIILEKAFRGQKIVPVESNEIAKDGGVLNCISWNILS